MDLKSNPPLTQSAIDCLTWLLDSVKDGSINLRSIDASLGDPLVMSAYGDVLYERTLTFKYTVEGDLTINFTMKGDLDAHHQ